MAATSGNSDDCKYGKDKNGNCNPPPVVVEPPKGGPCSQADLVLLEDLLPGTGGLVCLYLGDNAPNAAADKDCPDALLALPLDNLLGACVFLPPVDIPESSGTAASTAQLAAVQEATGSTGLQEVESTLSGLLNLGG